MDYLIPWGCYFCGCVSTGILTIAFDYYPFPFFVQINGSGQWILIVPIIVYKTLQKKYTTNSYLTFRKNFIIIYGFIALIVGFFFVCHAFLFAFYLGPQNLQLLFVFMFQIVGVLWKTLMRFASGFVAKKVGIEDITIIQDIKVLSLFFNEVM